MIFWGQALIVVDSVAAPVRVQFDKGQIMARQVGLCAKGGAGWGSAAWGGAEEMGVGVALKGGRNQIGSDLDQIRSGRI